MTRSTLPGQVDTVHGRHCICHACCAEHIRHLHEQRRYLANGPPGPGVVATIQSITAELRRLGEVA